MSRGAACDSVTAPSSPDYASDVVSQRGFLVVPSKRSVVLSCSWRPLLPGSAVREDRGDVLTAEWAERVGRFQRLLETSMLSHP